MVQAYRKRERLGQIDSVGAFTYAITQTIDYTTGSKTLPAWLSYFRDNTNIDTSWIYSQNAQWCLSLWIDFWWEKKFKSVYAEMSWGWSYYSWLTLVVFSDTLLTTNSTWANNQNPTLRRGLQMKWVNGSYGSAYYSGIWAFADSTNIYSKSPLSTQQNPWRYAYDWVNITCSDGTIQPSTFATDYQFRYMYLFTISDSPVKISMRKVTISYIPV